MVDSVITHANKTASTVYWKCLLCSQGSHRLEKALNLEQCLEKALNLNLP